MKATDTVLSNVSLRSTSVINGDWRIEGLIIAFEDRKFAVHEADHADIALRSNILQRKLFRRDARHE